MRSVLVRLGRRVQERRLALGMSQENMAERMGLDAKHLQLIEAGETNPTVATLVGVAKGLEVELDELLRRSG